MKKIFFVIIFFNSLFAGYFNEALKQYEIGNEKKALELFRESCNSDISNCSEIANMFLDGNIIEQNESYAKEFYKKSCYLNDYSSCYYVGYLFLKEKDHPNALKYLEYACNNDISDACFLASAIHYKTYKDDKNYVNYLQKACQKGDYQSCSQIALIYYKGKHKVSVDKYRAYRLFYSACEKGKRDESCLMLGYFNQVGEVVEKNLYMAENIYKNLCSKEYKKACIQLENFYQKVDTTSNQEYLKSKEKVITKSN
ncbi:tetratricopeptide repeat protein [Halarcobacter ebronensis]|uniref:beta-lactamase n=1 Tax=Halarcobacter ebronensis TaxID=1462615 RepID=A0A4Q1ASU5_9BACT|nr:tetratricopeptide repeat protein [Halarcobacter ebronensis]QKF82396.1 Sel1 domain-containing protein [Halarcobacter ebronensis]RXK07581.1 hypothetical protein CRV07_03720 [Halarcobacter ebronensis]